MNESRGVGFQFVVLAIALVVGVAGRVLAADDIDGALNSAGKVWYDKYCTPCHGAGGAPGSAVASATKKPVDLRGYVKAHGGKFPAADWLAILADSRPQSPHADVWRTIQKDQIGAGQEAAARGVVGSIARYIRSIQAK